MRNFKVLALTMAFLILISYTAFAGDIGTKEDTGLSAGEMKISIGYDSPLYGIKLFWEKVRLAASLTDTGKANLESRFALRRIAEADLLIQEQRYEAVQRLMEESAAYLTKATGHAADALIRKDTERARDLLDGVSKSQYAVLEYINMLAEKYPGTFEMQQMTLDIKDSMSDVIVVQAFLSYKENLFKNPQIKEAALAALDAALALDEGLDDKDIALQVIESIEESGNELTQDEIDAITSATYDVLQEAGGLDGPGTDATTSASLTVEPGIQLQAGDTGVDATTSATITANEPSAPSGGSPVDAVTSATPTAGSGSSSSGGASYEDDDHHESHEEDDDDDEHEHEEDDD